MSLVIPARNAERTLDICLRAAVPQLQGPELEEIIVVDDGSTDRTAAIAARHAVRVIRGSGKGPGAARNLGWRSTKSPLVWFIDADCVVEPGALAPLIEQLEEDNVAGAGGSYGNMRPDSLLATLIHEEIVERHLAMPREVDFLATFNVVYRRDCLEMVGGFDEALQKAQDAELAYRMRKAGARLRFDSRSRVKHFHPDRLGSYLRTQRQQGYWRVWLYSAHPDTVRGDSYSGWLDHIQPPLAAVTVLSLPLVIAPILGFLPVATASCLLAAQLPATWKIVRRTRDPRLLLFAPMSFIRAFWRAAGMTAACVRLLPRLALNGPRESGDA